MKLQSIKLGFIFLCTIGSMVYGQVSVSGCVTDAKTNEPIPFVAVQFKGTTIGTTTDFDGHYSLTSPQSWDSLRVSAMGYIDRTKAIQSANAVINFQLQSALFNLDEVVVHAGKNPAHAIIHEASKRKSDYNFEKAVAVEYEAYQITDIALTNIGEGFRSQRAMRSFTRIFDSLAKTAGEDGQVVLPFFIAENNSVVYRRTEPIVREKEVIVANRSSGYLMDNLNALAPMMGANYQKYNFNKNYLNLFDRNFMSPIADGSLLFYEAYLLDTVEIDGYKCFELKVKPKNEYEILFTGKIWLTVEDYALIRISAEINHSANLNFVKRFTIQQDYERLLEGYSVPQRSRLLIELVNVPGLSVDYIVKFNSYFTNYSFGEPKPISFFDKVSIVATDADRKDEQYWLTQRLQKSQDPFSVKQKFDAIDTIRQNPSIRWRRNAINLLMNGYTPLRKALDMGHYATWFGYNAIEGLRTQANLRTSYALSNHWQGKMMLAYGWLDHRLKYELKASWFIDRNRWMKLSGGYKDDYAKLIVQNDYFSDNSLLQPFAVVSTQFYGGDRIATEKSWFARYDADWGYAKTHALMFEHRQIKPFFDFDFVAANRPDTLHSYRTAELSYSLLFARKRDQIIVGNDRYFMQERLGNMWEFRYAYGIPFNGDYLSYHKFHLRYGRIFRVGMFGSTRLTITGAAVLGEIPTTEATRFQGNDSFFESYSGYNSMGFLEFVADRSVEFQVRHYFEGLLFNKIFLLKRLRWREIVGANVIWSDLHNQSQLVHSDIAYNVMNINKPYMEAYYSVDNIFNFLRVTAVHRLSYWDSPNCPNLFGLKGFSLKFSLNFSL
ncbi:collagen-binding protein [Bacteroidia bacterium]|nr:collagen-binding protein [Bacteroidia bacterium]